MATLGRGNRGRDREGRGSPGWPQADSPAVKPWASHLASPVTAWNRAWDHSQRSFPLRLPVSLFPRWARGSCYTILRALVFLPSLYSFKINPKTDHCSCSLHHPPWSSHQHLPPGPLQLLLHWAPSFCPNFNYSASHSAASRILLTFKSIHIPPLAAPIYLRLKGKFLTRT